MEYCKVFTYFLILFYYRNILRSTQKVETKKADVMTLHSTYRDDFVEIPDELRPGPPKRLTQDLKPAHYDPSLMTFHGLRQMPCTVPDSELKEEVPDVPYDKDVPVTFWSQHLAQGFIPMSAPEGNNPLGRSSTFTNDIFDTTKIHATAVDRVDGHVSGICTSPIISSGNKLTLKPILEDYRARFLEIAGISGIIGIRNIFKQHDPNCSTSLYEKQMKLQELGVTTAPPKLTNRNPGLLNQHDFHIALLDLQLQVTQNDLQLFFATFDPRRTGFINYNEFLDYFNLPINEKRMSTLKYIFGELSDHQPSVPLQTLIKHFDVYKFPSVKSKKVAPSFVNNDYRNSWESIIGDSDSVTEDQFIEYFSSYSSLLGDDNQFSNLMYECFELSPPAPPSTIKVYAYDIKGKLTKIDYEVFFLIFIIFYYRMWKVWEMIHWLFNIIYVQDII